MSSTVIQYGDHVFKEEENNNLLKTVLSDVSNISDVSNEENIDSQETVLTDDEELVPILNQLEDIQEEINDSQETYLSSGSLPRPIGTSTPISQFDDDDEKENIPSKPTYSHVGSTEIVTLPLYTEPNEFDLAVARGVDDFLTANPDMRERLSYCAPEVIAYRIFQMTGINIPALLEAR